jgi:hypothetical protein
MTMMAQAAGSNSIIAQCLGRFLRATNVHLGRDLAEADDQLATLVCAVGKQNIALLHSKLSRIIVAADPAVTLTYLEFTCWALFSSLRLH